MNLIIIEPENCYVLGIYYPIFLNQAMRTKKKNKKKKTKKDRWDSGKPTTNKLSFVTTKLRGK